ncbi:MAG: VOC family protein [Candidatus Palauibacterales bacterium]|nr:VOC family protein [Candidatus Palauibacterales bacterium]MDP2529679.1 VOC family protein [Candidatus Palauibacterales bacterium]MDP2584095.1 VOC family protein [Candidatus Palauibacterales bacterium]
MDEVSVRYIVDDMDDALAFYTERLGFEVVMRPARAFAILSLGEFHLMLSAPTGEGGGAQAMPDGRRPEPGGWNRIQIRVQDVEAEAARLRAAGVVFRGGLITGVGAKQVLLEDPSGNPVELFELRRA